MVLQMLNQMVMFISLLLILLTHSQLDFIDAGTNDVTIISSLGVTDDLGTGKSDAATDIIATNLTVTTDLPGPLVISLLIRPSLILI